MEPSTTNSQDSVHTVLCSHETEDGGVKFVMAECGVKPGLQHKIRQWGDGYICGRCAQMIILACNTKVEDRTVCYQCAGNEQLERFLSSKQICEHPNATISKVKLECIMTVPPQIHELDLSDKLICKQCERKLIYKYQGQKECKICQSKTNQLLKNLRHSLANEQMRMIKKLIIFLSEKKCSEEFKNQMEHHCLRKRTDGNKQREKKHEETCKLREHSDFVKKFAQLNHKESKYAFFTKCPNHKYISLKVCPTCIAVLLNLNMCPYGCELATLQENRVSKGKLVYETGFVILAPLLRKEKKGHFLQMVLVRNTTIRNKLDHTEAEIRQLSEQEGNQIREDDYPRFGGHVALNGNTYLLSGGMVTRKKEQSITADTWFIEVHNKEGSFSFNATKKAPMNVPRSGHSLVLYQGEIYAIGGINSKGVATSECERFSPSTNKWTVLPPLKYPRSKPTAFVRNYSGASELIVLGGLSTEMEVLFYGEKLKNSTAKEWIGIKDGNVSYVDQNALTKVICSTNHPQLGNLEDVLMIGGSNYQDYSDNISDYREKDGQFVIEPTQLKMFSKRAASQIGVLDTADKTRKKLVLFGGGLDHESIVDVEIIVAEITENKTLAPIYCDKISSDESSEYYRLLQCDRKKFYGELVQQLENSGISVKEKLVKETDYDTELQNRQTIETLWMWGRSVGSLQIERPKQ